MCLVYFISLYCRSGTFYFHEQQSAFSWTETLRLPCRSSNDFASLFCRICERQRDVDRDEDRGEDEDEDANPLGKWPHALSPALACLSCTLGLFNISRFSILSIQFGGEYRPWAAGMRVD